MAYKIAFNIFHLKYEIEEVAAPEPGFPVSGPRWDRKIDALNEIKKRLERDLIAYDKSIRNTVKNLEELEEEIKAETEQNV